MTAAVPEPVRWRNFDAVRLAAATAVMFSHSFALSAAGYDAEPLVRLLGEKNELGLYGVFTFFVISGFLITRSYRQRASIGSYALSRALRIFPALIVCAGLCAFALGPLFAESPRAYLTDGATYRFVADAALLRPGTGAGLPMQFYDGDYGSWVLGTFWTLPVEFTMYAGVLLLGIAGLLRFPAALALLAVGLWSHSQWPTATLGGVAWLLMFFAAGGALSFLYEKRRPPRWLAIACIPAWAIGALLGAPQEAFAIVGAVVVVQLATSQSVRLPDAARFGDFSYGLYLWGWPAQQVVRALWGPSITWLELFVLSMALGLLLAWASWRLVEDRALRLAQRYRRRVRARQPAEVRAPAAAA